jgi:hypothetical protein
MHASLIVRRFARRLHVTLVGLLLSSVAVLAAEPKATSQNSPRPESSSLDRKHCLSEIDILGKGSIGSPFVLEDPTPAAHGPLLIERSFASDLPESRDRETVETRHDENG